MRAQLPSSVKATLADWIDPRTAVIVGLSLFVHVGIATWALLTDGEVDRPSFTSNGVYHPMIQDEPIDIDADQLPAVATPVAQ